MHGAVTFVLISIGIAGGPDALAGVAPAAQASQSAKEASADVQTVARGINEFSLSLYGQLRSQSGNLICSPFSASTVLAMTMAGARGETAAQMEQALCLRIPNRELPVPYGELLRSLRARSAQRRVELTIASALWAQQGLSIEAQFQDVARRAYGGALGSADFARDGDRCRVPINAWVEEQTHRKIKDLIPAGLLNTDTRMVLVNAVHFLGPWESPFDQALTREGPFTLASGDTVATPMMWQRSGLPIMEDEAIQLLELPYRGGEQVMDVVLPRRADGLAELEASLDLSGLERRLASLETREVVLQLPPFRMRSQLALEDPLRAMGMVRAFEPMAAEFSGISATSLFVSAAIQQASVEVNERGTEAAAATALEQTFSEFVVSDAPIPFHADHPFLFLIRDRPTGTILFLGRVANPSQ